MIFTKRSFYKTPGMTLIEIVAAIAILAIVSVAAMPIYTSYINRSRVAAALPTLTALEQIAKAQYEENTLGSSIIYSAYTFNSGTVTAIDAPPVVNAMYKAPSSESYISSDSFMVCVYVGQLSFTGYVAPTAGSAGSYSRICRLVTAGEHIYTNRCGALDGGSSDIPVSYLPRGCDCANVSTGSC